MKNTFWSKKNLAWFSEKCFPFILEGNHFLEVVKKSEISCYLLIILSLVLNILIYIFLIFFNFIH
jgi:hypothetical protein